MHLESTKCQGAFHISLHFREPGNEQQLPQGKKPPDVPASRIKLTFVNYVIASRQMADVQTEGILYRKLALLESLYSECSLQHSPQ